MAIAGMVLQGVGMFMQISGQMKQTEALKKAEAQREKQMNLEASRQRRDVVRNAIMARAVGVSNAANQGALYGSGVPGAAGQISGRAGNQLVASGQNQQIGSAIFAANREYYDASIMSDLGSGLSSLGGMLVSNAGTFSRVGQTGFFGGNQGGGGGRSFSVSKGGYG